MADKNEVASGEEHWDASDQSLLAFGRTDDDAYATDSLGWREALQLSYASGALKPRRFITKEEWEAIGLSQ